jgi:adhesin transport system membrane fusion protein
MKRLTRTFTNDIEAALDRYGSRRSGTLLLTVTGGLVAALLWAHLAVLEEVTHGEGKVIPSSQLQVVQPLEGGIVSALHVKEGQKVEAGAPLVNIDDTGFASSLGEVKQKLMAMLARKARLEAEANEKDPSFSGIAVDKAVIDAELALFTARKAALADEVAVANQQLAQKRLERTEVETRLKETKATIGYALRELELARSLKSKGAFPELELLKLERQYRSDQRDVAMLEATLPRTEAAISEATAKLSNASATFRARAREGLTETNANIAVFDESMRAAEDRVRRTTLRAPVRGVINKLVINTIGAVVRPGESIVEIVPIEEKLLIEARVRPQDVAFIHPGQAASIKVTAYTYTVYGDLPGEVERIGADTIPDEKGNPFYRVILRTKRNHLGDDKSPLPIIPGMVVTADIQTGRKSVLDYLFQPIQVIRSQALTER